MKRRIWKRKSKKIAKKSTSGEGSIDPTLAVILRLIESFAKKHGKASIDLIIALLSGVRVLNTKQASEYLGVSPKTLQNWRSDGSGPQFERVGGSIRYTLSSLDQFLSERTYASTSSYAEN